MNPQFFAFRWITLLLTQEFPFPDAVRIWDTLLSDPTGRMDCLLRVCLALLMHVRTQLLAGGHVCCTLWCGMCRLQVINEQLCRCCALHVVMLVSGLCCIHKWRIQVPCTSAGVAVDGLRMEAAQRLDGVTLLLQCVVQVTLPKMLNCCKGTHQ